MKKKIKLKNETEKIKIKSTFSDLDTICLPHVLLLIHHASTSRPPCLYLKATMPCPCALTSYSLISVTMCVPCVHHEEPLFLDVIPNPNSFQTLSDPSRPFQPLSHALHPLQINNNTIYLCPANPNPSQSLSTLSSYNTIVLFFLGFFFFFLSFSFFCFFSSLLFISFSFFFSSFYFYHSDFSCFGLYYLLHSSEHLVIFTSPVFQSISELQQASHNIPKITLYF